MAGLKKISRKIWLLVFCFCIFCSGKVSAVQEEGTTGAEAGVVEVQSGFLDGKGKFWVMKSGSGFLIANNTNATYIITNSSNVSNTPRAIKKYCKKNLMDTENMQFSNYIQIVVKGDITAEAEVVVQSAGKDYCVLSVANVVSQKESLKLGDSAKVAVHDPVFAYGFLKDAGTQEGGMDYSEADVKMLQGIMTENDTGLDQNAYLVHTAPVAEGYAGGPLLDADGYVIGLTCKLSEEDDTGLAYALPINEIRAVLDNFSIYYKSRKIDEAYATLQALYTECTALYEAGGYKRDSVEVLEKALTETGEILQQEEPGAADLEETGRMLLAAKDGLVPKMKKLMILMIGLGVCDGILFLWVLILIIINKGEKKRMNIPYYQHHGLDNIGTMESKARTEQYLALQRDHIAEHKRQQISLTDNELYLMCKKTGRLININKHRFVVGKNQSDTDYCIMNNQTVSRKHAVLFEDNGNWYIDDLNSLNGTYVNGRRILPGQAVRLNNGDEIVLSDEVFFVQG